MLTECFLSYSVWLTQCTVQLTWCAERLTRCVLQPTRCMWGVVGRLESVSHPPPMWQKNKFLLNEYLGIFMHFESIFFYFLNLENGLFQTHPPTKSGEFQIFYFFFEPFPYPILCKRIETLLFCDNVCFVIFCAMIHTSIQVWFCASNQSVSKCSIFFWSWHDI